MHSVIRITPPFELNSPIEYVQLTPKGDKVMLHGKINFRALSLEGFFASHSDLSIKFINR